MVCTSYRRLYRHSSSAAKRPVPFTKKCKLTATLRHRGNTSLLPAGNDLPCIMRFFNNIQVYYGITPYENNQHSMLTWHRICTKFPNRGNALKESLRMPDVKRNHNRQKEK
jgi:hypothetical protein